MDHRPLRGDWMRCIVNSHGSAGDFLPALAVGAALHRRGHEVRLVANPFYASHARHAGLELVPAGEPHDLFEQIEKTPAYLSAANFGMLLRDLVAPHVEASYPVVRALLRDGTTDVIVANDAGFGALWAAAEAGRPVVLVQPSPLFWMGWHAPGVFGDRALARLLSRPLSLATSRYTFWYMTRFLRALAVRCGARPPEVSYGGSQRRAALRAGLWSPLLRGPLPGDPPNGTICGFARASALGGAGPDVPPEVTAFLDAGPPPVVVGLGSAFALLAGPLLANIAGACADLGRRCLVVGHPAGLALPAGTLAVRWAPYDVVFPRAAAVVVHGGAGTTGEALRSGTPVVGVPLAYDQFGLCDAIERLRVGVRVPVARRTRKDLAGVLDRVLSDDAMRRRAVDSGRRFAAEPDGAETAADAVERLVGRRVRRASAAAHPAVERP